MKSKCSFGNPLFEEMRVEWEGMIGFEKPWLETCRAREGRILLSCDFMGYAIRVF